MIMKVFGGSWGLGAFLGLQIQWSASEVDGGFDSHILPPTQDLQGFRGSEAVLFCLQIPQKPQFYSARHHESAEPKDRRKFQ